jgi:hypothetical protein
MRCEQEIILYTVLTQGYDMLPEIEPEPGMKYWLFTDDESLTVPEFLTKSLLANHQALSSRRLSRLPKLCPHLYLPPHSISIYVDANIKLIQPIRDFAISCVQNSHIAIHRHPKRGCIYEEGKRCISQKLDERQIIELQLQRYRNAGFPTAFGLTENNCIVRRNSDAVIQLNECWHREYIAGSQRDQLSFMYAVWRTGTQINILTQSSRRNAYYYFRNHLRPRHQELSNKLLVDSDAPVIQPDAFHLTLSNNAKTASAGLVATQPHPMDGTLRYRKPLRSNSR